jgi:ABC-type ATPase involved in cell division
MKHIDLSSGASKMSLALKQLEIKWDSAKDTWNDATSKAFHKEHIEPLRPDIKETLEAIGRPRAHIKEAVPQILELVGLAQKSDNMPDELSGGEQQRVSIARAFVNRPLILLADEPTGNLDPATSVGIMKLLDRINRTGTTVVMATHDRGIVDTMRKRVIELDRGRVVRDQARGVYE